MTTPRPVCWVLKSEINVTPMIDVLLVLLIIFMVISPSLPVGLDSQIPQPAPASTPEQIENERALVISMQRDSSLQINQETIPAEELPERLRAILKARRDRNVFLQADPDHPFAAVADAIDGAKSAGADRIGLLTDKLPVTHL